MSYYRKTVYSLVSWGKAMVVQAICHRGSSRAPQWEAGEGCKVSEVHRALIAHFRLQLPGDDGK